MSCYGLSESLAQTLVENANVKFLCDKCTAVNSLSVKECVTTLADNFKEIATEFEDIKSAVGEMKEVLHTVNVTLPPAVWYNEMHDALDDIKTSTNSTAMVVNEIRATCDPLSVGGKTNELLQSLLTAMTPATETNNKIVELLSDIRSAAITAPKPIAQSSYSAVVNNNKRSRSPRSSNDFEVGPRHKRAAAIMGTGPDTSEFVIGGQNQRVNSIVISPLHPSTSLTQIKSFIANKLGIATDSNDFSVVSLAPRGRSLDELSFISFKVSSIESLFVQLTTADFWPKGTTYRPFEERARKSVAVSLPEAQQSDQSSNATAPEQLLEIFPENVRSPAK